MNQDATRPYELSDDDFDALEALLTSDVVPEDCMNLEMLDGYLAAVVSSPEVVPVERWLPGVWSAHGDEVSFSGGSRMQRAIQLVLAYYNELVDSVGDEDGWEPFCYAVADGDTIGVGEEWIEGFAQGLELWPVDWPERIPDEQVRAVNTLLEETVEPWAAVAEGEVEDEIRLQWLEYARDAIIRITDCWRMLDLPAASPVEIAQVATPRESGPGRNEPCPCGSGKKYKKCCGAD